MNHKYTNSVGVMRHGNFMAVAHALEKIGATVCIIDRVEKMTGLKRIVLPGVGSYSEGSRLLFGSHLALGIKSFVNDGGSILGICLGMHLLCESGTENSKSKGLGFIPGSVESMSRHVGDDSDLKLPVIGWYQPRLSGTCKDAPDWIVDNLSASNYFYYGHSYEYTGSAKYVAAIATYAEEVDVPSVIISDNVIGVQFHPERSGLIGLEFLRRWSNR